MPAQTLDHDLDEILAAFRGGDQTLARDAAAAAMQQGSEHPVVLLLAAERLELQGSVQQALGLLEKALGLVGEAASQLPDEAELWRRTGEILVRQGMPADAREAFDTALTLAPDNYPALIAAGAAAYQMADLPAAYGHYQQAANLRPDQPDVLATLALVAARRQLAEEARNLGERALALEPNSLTAQLALGRADLLQGFSDRAEARMTSLLDRTDLNDQNRVNILDLRADARDAQDRPADAFADYAARNAVVERLSAPAMNRLPERRIDQARRLANHFATASAATWRAGAGEDAEGARSAAGHVFLLGFPRSGTTLLEKVLSGHPQFVTLEEADNLAPACSHFLASDIGLNSLSTLTAQQADDCRQTYWHGVRQTVGDDLASRIVVDKLPLHTIALPAIAKLFPKAKILFALRDPRDVVLSCFRRRFQMNSAMYEFLTLEGTARYYDQVMHLAKIYRALLPLDIHEVRHEAMVANFENEVREVLSFIGVAWDPAVADFATRARGVQRTPSDLQLTRGLNAEGVGQWRRYQPQLAPALELLAPWVEYFNRGPRRD